MSERLEKGIVDQELSEASLKFLDRRSCKEVKGIHPVPESREKKNKGFPGCCFDSPAFFPDQRTSSEFARLCHSRGFRAPEASRSLAQDWLSRL